MNYYCKNPKIKLIIWYYFFLYKLGKISEYNTIKNSATILKNIRADKFCKTTDIIFEKFLKFKIYESIRVLIKDHKKRGHKVIIITDTITPLANAFANYINADFLLASNLEESNLRYTGNIIHWYTGNNNIFKINHIVKNFNLKLDQSFAYSSSKIDLPWLKLIKNKTIVNPDNHFKNYAKKRKWEIINI